jgi:hypothetical protein
VNAAEWLTCLRVAVDDADAAARDMLRAPRRRGLGPRQHRKLYRGAAKQIRSLLDHPPFEAPEGAAPATPAAPEPATPAAAAAASDVDTCLMPRDTTWRSDPLVRAALDTTFAKRRNLPPLARARQKILWSFIHTFRGPVRGVLAEEIDGIAPDIVDAAVEAVLARLAPSPAEKPAST